jgi:hypothetical protein
MGNNGAKGRFNLELFSVFYVYLRQNQQFIGSGQLLTYLTFPAVS